MRILFSTAPGVGHVLPLLPLARQAVDGGHEVVVAGGSSLAGILRDASLTHASMGAPTIESVVATIPELADLTGRRRALVTLRRGFAGPLATGMAEGLLALFETWRPELIVREDTELGSWVAAERAGIPHLSFQTTAFRPHFWSMIGEPMATVRAAFHLPGAGSYEGLIGRAYLATRPAALRAPDAPYPAVTHDIRPMADDRRPGDPTADPFPPRDGRPRVAITLGTVNGFRVPVMRALIDGAVAAEAQVIVAAGADPTSFGDVPESVDVRAYVPISLLVEHADVIAFHGGSGTMLAAVAAGTPMVIVPLAADQPDNADVCAAAGIARVVALETLSADAVEAAIRAVVADDAMRERSAAVAAELAGMPGPDAALRVIEDMAG